MQRFGQVVIRSDFMALAVLIEPYAVTMTNLGFRQFQVRTFFSKSMPDSDGSVQIADHVFPRWLPPQDNQCFTNVGGKVR